MHFDANYANIPRLTKEIDDAIVVACKQSDKISKKQHESRIDHTIVQVVGRHVEIQQGVDLILQCGQSFDELFAAHLTKSSTVLTVIQNSFLARSPSKIIIKNLPTTNFAKVKSDSTVG